MSRIRHNNVRFADGLVWLNASSASSYRRIRNNTFKLQAVFNITTDQPIDVVGMAVASIQDLHIIDILIDDQLSVAELSSRKFGTGWTIVDNDDVIEVNINDLFMKHAVTLRIESTVVLEAADLLRQAGVAGGNIFYACPSPDFRFSIFCPLGQVFSKRDVLYHTQVDFCVSLPKFIDQQQTNVPLSRTRPSDAYLTEPSSKDMTLNQDGIRSQITKPASTNHVAAAEILEEPVGASEAVTEPKINAIRPETCQSLVAFGAKTMSNIESQDNSTEASIRLLPQKPANVGFKGLNEKYDDFQPDINLCVLLDEKIDTAIAAAAYLVSEYPYVVQLAEIGLWRRRFKSVLSRFANVSEVFELSHFPISTTEYQEISDFLIQQRLKMQPAQPFIVIGQEMLDDLSSGDFAELIGKQFESISLVVVGQSDLALSARLSGVSHLAEIADECTLLIGSEPVMDVPGILTNCTGVRRFYLPPYLKLSLLVAEKSGLASEKLRELASQIIPG